MLGTKAPLMVKTEKINTEKQTDRNYIETYSSLIIKTAQH